MSNPEQMTFARYFFIRNIKTATCVVLIILVAIACAWRCSFDPLEALIDFPGGVIWSVQHFTPTIASLDKLPKILFALWSTFLGAVAAALVSAVFAYAFALLGCRTVGFGGIIELIVRGVATISRNIPNVAWAFMLAFSFGQSEFTGFLVLFMKSFGFLTRMFLETMDEIPQGAMEALKTTGANRIQIIAHVVIPLTSTQIMSWLLYMAETNTRDATLVGMLTGSGIGFVFELFYRTFRYDVAGLVIICVAVMALICELLSNYIRRKILADSSKKSSIKRSHTGHICVHVPTLSNALSVFAIITFAALTVAAFFQMSYGDVDLLRAAYGAFENFGVMVLHPGTDGFWTLGELFSDLVLTLSLAVLTTLIGSVIAFFVALFAACNLSNRLISNALKAILALVRAIPTIIWVLVFVVAISLGAEACIVGMMFHTVAFLAKAYSESFEELDKEILDAIKSTGANWWQIVACCIVPEKIQELISWTFIRLENNFVNTVVIAALCGSGGIGYELFMAANFYFSLSTVGLITYMCLAVSILLEVCASVLLRRFAVHRIY